MRAPPGSRLDPGGLSADGRAVLRLLAATDPAARRRPCACCHPPSRRASRPCRPWAPCDEIEAPLIVLLHDRYDPVIPVGESRRLWAALSGRAGVRYTELGFRHLDPTRLSPLRLARELPRLYLALYPLFHRAMA